MTELNELDPITERIVDGKAAEGERDRKFVELRVSGHAWKDIAAKAGLSFQATQTAAKRANGGVLPQPDPKQLRPGSRIVG